MKRLILGLVVLLILVVLINSIVELIVFSNDNGVIKVKPVFIKSTEVELRYIHSVARTPVHEYFTVDNNRFILYKTVFESYGAGLPLDGGDFRRENGRFVQEGQNIKLEQLIIRVSRTKGQEIIVAGKVYDLQDLLEPGQRLTLDLYPPLSYIRFRLNKIRARAK